MRAYGPSADPRDRRRAERNADRQAGFTLVELLVVLVILSLVSGLVAPRVLGYLSDARTRTTDLQLDALMASLDLFYLDTGRYPAEREGLSALLKGNGIRNWAGPYIQQSNVPTDPWGNPYAYRVEGGVISILSFGPDGIEGGQDDVESRSTR